MCCHNNTRMCTIMVSSVCGIAYKMSQVVPALEHNTIRILQWKQVCETRYQLSQYKLAYNNYLFLCDIAVLVFINQVWNNKLCSPMYTCINWHTYVWNISKNIYVIQYCIWINVCFMQCPNGLEMLFFRLFLHWYTVMKLVSAEAGHFDVKSWTKHACLRINC